MSYVFIDQPLGTISHGEAVADVFTEGVLTITHDRGDQHVIATYQPRQWCRVEVRSEHGREYHFDNPAGYARRAEHLAAIRAFHAADKVEGGGSFGSQDLTECLPSAGNSAGPVSESAASLYDTRRAS